MKRFLLLLTVVLSLPVVAQEQPADSLPQQQVRYGYLSYETALAALSEHAAMVLSMDSLRAAYQVEMKRVEDEFNKKYEDFLDGQKDFPRTILLKRQNELQDLLQRNLAFKKQWQDEMKQTEQRLMAPLQARLSEAIAAAARQNGLALVLNTDGNTCLFMDPQYGINLQEAVEALLNPAETPAEE